MIRVLCATVALAYILDDIFALHRAPSAHPERPERVRAVGAALSERGVLTWADKLPLRRADEEEIARVHSAQYLEELIRIVPGRSGWLDRDTYYCEQTWSAVLCAAAGCIDLAASVIDGAHQRGFAVIRPPGHHAESSRAMGFCLVNNVAAAAAAARARGVARVAIVDWDVHHGNGTQEIFYRDPNVLYLSVHQYPFYPGTGAASEVGEAEGRGATINIPLPAGCTDADYAHVFDELVVPELHRFRPQLLIVSAGFDAHGADPLAGMRLTATGFSYMAARLRAVADHVCDGRLLVVLEGGYDLEALGTCTGAVLDVLGDLPPEIVAMRDGPQQPVANIVVDVRKVLDAERGSV